MSYSAFDQNLKVLDHPEETNLEKKSLAAGFLVFILFYFTGLSFISSLGLGISAYVIVRLLFQFGRTFPILELTLAFAAVQWILGPMVDYHTETSHYKYTMYVEELEYMNVVVPCFLIFVVVTLFGTTNKRFETEKAKLFLKNHPQLPFVLIFVGFLSSLTGRYTPGSLGFVFYLLGLTKYVGIGYILLTDSKYKWIWFLGLILLNLIEALKVAMFHEFILWSIFLFMYAGLVIKISLFKKILFFGLSVVFLFSLQAIKKDFRTEVWSGNTSGSNIELFFTLLEQKAFNPNAQDEINEVNTRFNQGWIISIIIDRFPRKQDFLGGETVNTAVSASLLPRFLDPEKKGGGGKFTFEALTGLTLLPGTSMGTSLMGEFYGNYGFWGAILAFGFWGFLLNLVYKRICYLQFKYPTIMLWLPLLFLQVVKAESDLITVLNHLVKASIVLFLIYFIANKVFKVQL